MIANQRIYEVRRLIFEYVKSPSLRHLRDPASVNGLSERIIAAIDREPSIWQKWEGLREILARGAASCWVPVEDLQASLNDLPGPRLTLTDVAQRLRAIQEEPFETYPNEALREGCLALYAREKAEGTEMAAIVGALQEFVEFETERLRKEREEAWRRRQEEERLALERRFLSGADCKWTPIQKSRDFYARKNGRTYRLSQDQDKRWELSRIKDLGDAGYIIGTYSSRTDANKVLAKVAYEPEW